jgi:hypothetical protein
LSWNIYDEFTNRNLDLFIKDYEKNQFQNEDSFLEEMYRRYMLWDLSWKLTVVNTKQETVKDIDDLLNMGANNDDNTKKKQKKWSKN